MANPNPNPSPNLLACVNSKMKMLQEATGIEVTTAAA